MLIPTHPLQRTCAHAPPFPYRLDRSVHPRPCCLQQRHRQAWFGTGGQPAATDRARRWQLDRGPAPAELQLDADDLR
ncbi:hypothetical protein G6F56_014595 [Rhizopus delemar]|nr:hypothetical protein G6F56_014595 [Rhizopus delemar]